MSFIKDHLMNKIILFAVLFTSPAYTSAQILPKEGSMLNFRIIGFVFPSQPLASNYLLEIAEGDDSTAAGFTNHLIKSIKVKKNKVIAEVPDFSAPYTWRTSYIDKKKQKKISEFHHFYIGTIPEIDTAVNRLRVIKKAKQYAGAFVFLDANKALYNMSGRPVWYLPTPESKNAVVRDLKLSPQSTITYEIDEKGAYEIDYNGRNLWSAPNNGAEGGDSIEHNHHEFTRLTNGHYMILAQNFKYWKTPKPGDRALIFLDKRNLKSGDSMKFYNRTPMAAILEYNDSGKLVWSWRSSDHFYGSVIYYRQNAEGGMQMTPHENSFYFDERAKAVYISCRNLNRIIRIKYPEGTVANIFGNDNSIAGQPHPERENVLFCGQHSCRIGQKGYLYMYNNNTCTMGGVPFVELFKIPVAATQPLKKIWEYKCIGPGETVESGKRGYPSGGNVLELPDQSFFVSMAYPDSRLFIVDRKKERLWSAFAEKWDPYTKVWASVNIFRASIIPSRTDLERLIWKAEGL